MHSLKKTRRLVFSDFDPLFETAAPFVAATRAPALAETSVSALPVSRAMPAICDVSAMPLLPYHRTTWKESHGLPVSSPMTVSRRRFQRRSPLPPAPALPPLPALR